MSQTATARAELLHLHARGMPHHAAMPRPISPTAPSSTSKENKPRPDLLKGKTLDGEKRPADRPVLGRVNVNVPVLQKRFAARTALPSKPRPATVPDVFAAGPGATRLGTAGTAGALGKRARETPPVATTSKRAKADALVAKSHRDEQERWAAKWQKAFPTLVFHFELSVDEGNGRGLRERVLKLGARIDQFFSQRVTHLVVKGEASPTKSKPAPRRGLDSDNPFLDRTGVTDLVSKADKMGIKVWTMKKLSDMLGKLDPLPDGADGHTLSNLLADEKLHGTRERDFTAPRPDYYYFKPGSKFLLVEDATGRHRAVMIKEYSGKDQDWPSLHQQFMRLTSASQLPPSVQESDNLAKDVRARAWALFVDNVPYKGEQPPAPTLQRSSSLRDMQTPVTPLPEAVPYANASGNSVVLTSNVASTSTAHITPGVYGGTNGSMNQFGGSKSRAIMQMSKRVQVLKGNARLAGKPTADGIENYAPGCLPSLPGQTLHRRKSTGMDAPTAPAATKEFISQAQVVAMLKQLRAPTTQTKPSYEERLRNREEVDAGYKRKEQDTASGYCENCRVRYTDLSVHMVSRKHRKFAQNAGNFADLDDMLQSLQRPPNPLMCLPTEVCRPCTKRHDKDAMCGRCRDDPALYSSPAPSSQPGSAHKQYIAHHYDFDQSEDEDEEMPEEVPEDMTNDEAAEPADLLPVDE